MTQGSQTRALGRFHRDLHWMVPDFSLWLSKSTGIMFLPFYVYTNILKTSLHIWGQVMCTRSFPSGSDGKEFACYAGDLDSIPGWGRSPGEGNGNPLQHSCLENSMDRRAWQATVHGVTKSQTHWVTNTLTSQLCSMERRCTTRNFSLRRKGKEWSVPPSYQLFWE